MVEVSEAAKLMSGVGDIAVNILILLFGLIFIGGLCFGLFLLVRRRKQYNQFKCIIWGRDAFGQLTETTDKAGIFVDAKTKNKRFFLKKAHVGLNPDNVPYIQSGKVKIVYLLRTGLKNFQFIRPLIADNFTIDVGEEDVNWAVNAYERQKKVFGSSMLLQYMPFIVLAFVSIIVLVIFMNLFKKFDVLGEIAASMSQAATAMAQAQTGTVVLT